MRLDSFSGGINLETYRHHVLSMAGWSAAALGRILARLMKPDDIAQNLIRLSSAIEKYNAASKALGDLYKERATLENEKKQYQKQMKEAEKEDVATLSLRIGLVEKNLQGLVDWLTKNSSHPEAKKLLDRVIAVRAKMIRSDNDLTFFEVRVPEGTSRRDYALLLKDVLHCTNPSIQYCDTEKLLAIAEEEVPGCMDMLWKYPLRLIDPVNKRIMGFYKFKPYIHSMFVQYVPPLNTGKVIERYHEVDDRTKPLSSGLNLQLFLDPYAVIPTIYHEYQHFCGDRNEASVFLRTQMFSTEFYKKYKEAKASADGVFATLAVTLGTPPAPNKREALNALIKRYYGEQMSKDEATAHAEKEIAQINNIVDMGNKMETWCPEILMPHLSEAEDKENWSLIKNIIVRYDTVPKSVTAEEFDSIISGGWKEPPEKEYVLDDDELQKLLGEDMFARFDKLLTQSGKQGGL